MQPAAFLNDFNFMENQRNNSLLYDLWECEDNNLQNKQTSTHIPSVLSPVTLPDEGISYNPPYFLYPYFL
ncbi:hypothetical protein ACQ4LE_004311 [Meloidogyne hapla]